MRVLCLDVGAKRIGVAVSDPLDITAQGVETIWSKGAKNDQSRILELCQQYKTDRILIGLPENMDGSEGFQAQHIREFAAELAQLGLNVRFQDERLTTQSATRVLLEGNVRREKRKDVVDKLAACYILQSFLDFGGWPDDRNDNLPNIRGVWRMNEDQEMNMQPDDVVELIDEDGKEVRFEHLMTLEHKGSNYICLVPLDPMEDVGEDELVILKIETDEDGNDTYVSVDDDEELDDVFEAYLEIAEADEDEE